VSENGAKLLEARGVTKRFGTLAALKDISFEMREGEILGVIGPNGAGKTTLVNVISGSAPGWIGEIRFRESSLRRLRPHRIGRIGIARTYQVAQPFGGMTALENVMVAALYGHERRASVRDARARAEEILEQLDGVAAALTRLRRHLEGNDPRLAELFEEARRVRDRWARESR